MLICTRDNDGSYQTKPIFDFIQAHSFGRRLVRVFNASTSEGFFLGLEYPEIVERIPIEAIRSEETPQVLGALVFYFEQIVPRKNNVGRKRRRITSDLIEQHSESF